MREGVGVGVVDGESVGAVVRAGGDVTVVALSYMTIEALHALDHLERHGVRPADGEVLVRNLYLSIDPTQRGWMSHISPRM